MSDKTRMSLTDLSKKLVRQLIRRQIRATDTGAYTICPDDVFLCSYPRSGNGWVRYLLAHYLVPEQEWNPVSLQSIVPDIHLGFGQLHEAAKPRVLKSHFMPDSRYPRIVYLVRDGRDMCVSYYDHCKKLQGYQDEFPSFVRELCLGQIWPGAWHVHVEQSMKQGKVKPFLLVRYEDLLANTQRELERILAFIGLEISLGRIAVAVKKSSLDQNWSKSQAISGHKEHGYTGGVCGRSGSWRKTFSRDLNLFFLEKAGAAMQLCGYTQTD